MSAALRALAAAIDPAPYEQALAGIDAHAAFERQLVQATEVTQRRIVDIWRLVSQIGKPRDADHRPLPDSPALVALFVLGSLFAFMTFAPRLYYAMASDGAAPGFVGRLDPSSPAWPALPARRRSPTRCRCPRA